MKENIILGVDIGGTGIKGGLINVENGEMITERHRLDTPQPATPEAVAATFKELVAFFNWKGPIGVGFPAIVSHGVALSAANIDPSWIGVNIADLLCKSSGCHVYVLNDADAAGVASMRFGAGKGEEGLVMMLTVGTGIGSALFIDGKLVPNTELGHLYLKNKKEVAEKYISKMARAEKDLSWAQWGKTFNKYLLHLQRLFSPDLIIIGGGGSKSFDEYKDQLTVDFRVKPAGYLNKAGAVGAAYYAWEQEQQLG
ncbi:polyphosphate--glucose phosphotransferase [Lewinella sp. LCG006]|uniref:polyphosphate--glucose phosphotransferase n=1 Tax=Lewinella sp. LCG006 TaxID=3231911 RepID=UPI0034609AE7